MYTLDVLAAHDPEVAAACGRELKRQRDNIELIASENVVSERIYNNSPPAFVTPAFSR